MFISRSPPRHSNINGYKKNKNRGTAEPAPQPPPRSSVKSFLSNIEKPHSPFTSLLYPTILLFVPDERNIAWGAEDFLTKNVLAIMNETLLKYGTELIVALLGDFALVRVPKFCL